MRITIDNTEYKIFFAYPSKKGKNGHTLECHITSGDVGTRDEQKQKIAFTKVKRDSRDVPNLVLGRWVALLKALNTVKLPNGHRDFIQNAVPLRYPKNDNLLIDLW